MNLLCEVAKSPSSPPWSCLCTLVVLLTPREGMQHIFISNFKKERGCYAGKSQESINYLRPWEGVSFFPLDSPHGATCLWKPKISLWSFKSGKLVAGDLAVPMDLPSKHSPLAQGVLKPQPTACTLGCLAEGQPNYRKRWNTNAAWGQLGHVQM